MKKNNNIIKLLITVLAIVFVIFIILIVIISQNKKENVEINTEVTTDVNEEGNDNYLEEEDLIFNYYKIKNSVQTYYNFLNREMYYYIDNNDNYTIKQDKEINENIMKYLSKDYIEQNSITSSNLRNFISLVNEIQQIEILELKSNIGKVTDKYLVHGVAINSNYELTEEFYLYIILDFSNGTFSIEPINKKINDISKVEIINKDENVENKEVNILEMSLPDSGESIRRYINRYKRLAIACPEIAYNYFDKEYREKRFGSVENFKKYVEKNKEEIRQIVATTYLIEYSGDNYEFIIRDQYDNVYIFDEKNILEYSVKLDTYTLGTDKFTNTYKTATNKEKVMMNIDKFFQMLNTNDFESAYAVLNPTFKATYFPTEEHFEQFMKQNIYTHANIKYANFSDEISGVFTYYLQLKNKANEEDKAMGMNVVMQLQEDTNFTLSFEVLK